MPPAEIRSDEGRAEWVTPTLKVLDARDAVAAQPSGPGDDGVACSADGSTACS